MNCPKCGFFISRDDLYKEVDKEDLARAEELQGSSPTEPMVALVRMVQNVIQYMKDAPSSALEGIDEFTENKMEFTVKTPDGVFHLLIEKTVDGADNEGRNLS